MQNISDGQLVSLAQQGSEAAFAELMRRHSAAMRKVAMGILRDTEEAEDELQNAWWKAWQHIGGFAGDARFTTWLTRIVMNQCLMRLRQIAARTLPIYRCAGAGRGARELRVARSARPRPRRDWDAAR